MSGHNKWSKIKRLKEKNDAEKSKVFGKLLRSISAEARRAKGNISDPSLRAAIEKAREFNVPNDNIERAVKKAADSGELERVTYEAYGPGGCALIIEALTSNRNKAVQEVKHILSENGFELAAQGSAAWAFEKSTDGWRANTEVPISSDDGAKLEKLINELEENEEVQDVFTNAS